jgi:hypothetical protein
MIIKVQSSDESKFYDIDLEKQTCVCEGFKAKKFCTHLHRSNDIYKLHGKTERWNIMSQYHKEIRRCDLERGLMWARAFARISGSAQASGYCKNILFEETRNLDLYEKYKTNSISEKEQIHGMILSRKKWELDYMKDHFLDWNKGFLTYYRNRDKWSAEYMVERMQSYQTPAEAYEILFFVSENKEADHNMLMVQGSTVEELFWVKMETKAIQENNERLKKYLSLKPTSYYGRMVALELGIGYWDEQANEYGNDFNPEKNYLPSSREYAFDCHGIIGQSRLTKNWKEVDRASFTKSSKIDLRWSGMLFGIYWRFECYKQHGMLTDSNGKDIPWDDVKLDPVIWRETMLHDSFYYGKFYQKLRDAGYSVPLVKEDVKTLSMDQVYEMYGPKERG